MYGSCEELTSQGIDPNFLLGMLKGDKDNEGDEWEAKSSGDHDQNKIIKPSMHV